MKNKLLASVLVFSLAVAYPLTPGVAADPATALPQSVRLSVPYASQVPFGQWNDPRQRDGCEEASIIMAMAWVRGNAVPAEEVKRDLINLAEYEKVVYGVFEDTSAVDTANLLRSYYGHPRVAVHNNISVADIKIQLAAGNLVLIPLNTQRLGNSVYYNGPIRHTVVVTGYDNSTGQIFIHDPILRQGVNLAVNENALNWALSDYSTGRYLPLGERRTAMIIVTK